MSAKFNMCLGENGSSVYSMYHMYYVCTCTVHMLPCVDGEVGGQSRRGMNYGPGPKTLYIRRDQKRYLAWHSYIYNFFLFCWHLKSSVLLLHAEPTPLFSSKQK